METNSTMIVIITDPTTNQIVGVVAPTPNSGHSDNTYMVTDPVSVAKIAAYFSKEPSPYNYQTTLYYVNDTVLVKPNIAVIKSIKIDELHMACTRACSDGFESDALGGTNHTYPSKELDQLNLHTAMLATFKEQSEDWHTFVWCSTSNNEGWNMRRHTMSQVKHVIHDLFQHIEMNRNKLKGLVDQINTVPNEPTDENAQQVRAVNW